MELFLVCLVVGVICLIVGALFGHSYAAAQQNKIAALLAQAKSSLSADEQALLDWWRGFRGKVPGAPVGGTAAPASTATTGTGTTTVPPTSTS